MPAGAVSPTSPCQGGDRGMSEGGTLLFPLELCASLLDVPRGSPWVSQASRTAWQGKKLTIVPPRGHGIQQVSQYHPYSVLPLPGQLSDSLVCIMPPDYALCRMDHTTVTRRWMTAPCTLTVPNSLHAVIDAEMGLDCPYIMRF